ncbi:zinc knuckle CX2CX4HX4C containing protein [Tanacetum coccineum]|uniref:Zinc knuckle CX2CX4HX4C containing protein n=1 Tax=Tanacetum coccineum TaxID=301880 RepID=A0ABQ5I070_9ASTR
MLITPSSTTKKTPSLQEALNTNSKIVAMMAATLYEQHKGFLFSVFVFDNGFWVKKLGLLQTSTLLGEEWRQMMAGANKKRSSTRSIRVPIRFGDSIHGIRKKNTVRNKQNEDDLIRKGDDDQGKVMGETEEMVGVSSENNKGFVGDLNSNDFPELQSRVNIPSSSIIHDNIDVSNKNVADNMMNVCDNVNEKYGKKGNTTGINVTKKIDKKFMDVANAVRLNNILMTIPTMLKDDGNDVVIFDDELIEKGSVKWRNTVWGYFVGSKVSFNEARYHLRRMWYKFGLGEMQMNDKGILFAKFSDERGMEEVINSGPWMARLINVPMEAWIVEGISAQASSLGKPIIMDEITAKMCKTWEGRLGYARVLVELNAEKKPLSEPSSLLRSTHAPINLCHPFFQSLEDNPEPITLIITWIASVAIRCEIPCAFIVSESSVKPINLVLSSFATVSFLVGISQYDKIEIIYKRKDDVHGFSKIVDVMYACKPPVCEQCSIFGHEEKNCHEKVKVVPDEVKSKSNEQEDIEFRNIQYRKNKNYGENNRRNVHSSYNGYNKNVGKQVRNDGNKHNQGKVEYKKKINAEKEKVNLVKQGNESQESNNNVENKENYSKGKNGNKKNTVDMIREGLKESNRFTLLDLLVDETELIPPLKDRKIIDEILSKHVEVNEKDMEKWSKDMKRYYKDKKELLVVTEELEKEEDVVDDISATGNGIIRNEIEGLRRNILI